MTHRGPFQPLLVCDSVGRGLGALGGPGRLGARAWSLGSRTPRPGPGRGSLGPGAQGLGSFGPVRLGRGLGAGIRDAWARGPWCQGYLGPAVLGSWGPGSGAGALGAWGPEPGVFGSWAPGWGLRSGIRDAWAWAGGAMGPGVFGSWAPGPGPGVFGACAGTQDPERLGLGGLGAWGPGPGVFRSWAPGLGPEVRDAWAWAGGPGVLGAWAPGPGPGMRDPGCLGLGQAGGPWGRVLDSLGPRCLGRAGDRGSWGPWGLGRQSKGLAWAADQTATSLLARLPFSGSH